MLQTEQTKRNFCEEEGLLVHEYLNIEVKEETELNKQNKNIGSQGMEIAKHFNNFLI